MLSGSQKRREAGNLTGSSAVRVEYLTSASDDNARPDLKDRFLWAAAGSAVLTKQLLFLRSAWAKGALAVALAEDDTYVNVPLLEAVAKHLIRAFGFGAGWHAGSYEWYNYQPQLFRATGFGGADRPMNARYWGQVLSNCSGARFDVQRDSARRCVGPIMFPKGPLHLLSRGVLRWLQESGALEAAEQRLARFKARGGRTAVNDVEFGFELVEASVAFGPLQYVSVSELGWIDKRGGGPWVAALRSDRLLAAHRLPFECWAVAERAVRQETFAADDYGLTTPRSPIDTSTHEAQHWVHPPTATLSALRRAGSAPPMRAEQIGCA